jgi:virulence-associated protein VapD
MKMNFSKNIKDLGLLSELAYLRLEDEYFKNKTYSYDDIDSFLYRTDAESNYLNNTGVDNSKDSMLAVLKKYDIKHFKSFSSDLQLMVLQEKPNGKYIISFRGTEFNLFSADITSDFEMALGAETDQMKDALNYIGHF